MRFGWAAYIVPFLFVYSPELILVGRPEKIAFDIATAFAGIWMISAGFVGFALLPLGALARWGFVVAGACLLIPLSLFSHALILNIAGAAASGLLLVWQMRLRTRGGPAVSADPAA
jgi:TRAP-type uncharacterized transport system fused permease subunit